MVDVIVVGAGVVGLTTGVRLQQSGARVTIVTAEEPARTVSAIAAAVWYPVRTYGGPRVLKWARRTFAELADQAARDVPGLEMRATRMLLRRRDHQRPWWAAAVEDFHHVPAAGDAAAIGGEWRFTVPMVTMTAYLDWLVERFTAAGGRIERRRIARLADVAAMAPVVVNATGLAAGELAGDPAVYPVRGQLVVVTNPGLTVSVRDEDNPNGLTYIHPRGRDVVLGGTHDAHVTDVTTDIATGEAIRRRCQALVPRLAEATVVRHLTGLRPARHGGARVAVDPDQLTAGHLLIHNYGHGGAGVTLAWGCADEVVELCRDAMPLTRRTST